MTETSALTGDLDVTGATLSRLLTPEGLRDPYPIYAELRTAAERGSDVGRVLLGYDECVTALSDRGLSSDRAPAILRQLPDDVRTEIEPVREVLASIVAFRDPPGHQRVRRLLQKAFLPGVVRRQHDVIETAARQLIDRLPDAGTGDLRAAITHPLPALVMAGMLGVPATDLDDFNRWALDIVFLVGSGRPTVELAVRTLNSVREMRAYMTDLVARRRRHPKDDLLSGMIAATEDGTALSEDEMFANALFLMTAGHETATNLIGNAMVALLRHPSEVARLRADPGLYPAAVDEVLRFESPVQMTARVALEDRDVCGRPVGRGQAILIFLGAANRDPARFTDPDRFDISRHPERHLAFASGPHYCLGAHLAREEAMVLLPLLIDQLEDLQLVDEEIAWQETIDFRGPTALDAQWSARQQER